MSSKTTSSISLSWSYTGGSGYESTLWPVTYYRISPSGTWSNQYPSSSTTDTVSNLAAGQAYDFFIRNYGKNYDGSCYSDSPTITATTNSVACGLPTCRSGLNCGSLTTGYYTCTNNPSTCPTLYCCPWGQTFSGGVCSGCSPQPPYDPNFADESSTSNSVSLSWSWNSGGNQNSNCPELFYRKQGTTPWISAVQQKGMTSYTVSGLSSSTTYEFYVSNHRITLGTDCDAVSSSQTCDWANTAGSRNTSSVPYWTIATTAGACTVTAPSGYGSSSVTTGSASLSWTPGTVVGTTQTLYIDPSEAKVIAGAGSLVAVSLTTSANSYSVSSLTAGTTYYWRVVTNASQACSVGCTAGNCPTFTTNRCTPQPIMDTDTTDESSTASSISVSWNPASGGDQNAFCPEVLYRKVGNPTYLSAVQTKAIWAFTIPSLAASTTYQIFVRDYRIQAGQNCSTSTAASICDYSTTAGATNSTSVPLWTIRTQDPVCLVTLPSGYSASGQTTSSANLAWTNGTGGTSQNIYVDSNVAKVVAGAGSLIAVGGLSATTNTYTASGLAAGTTYYWRVVTNASQACNIGCTGGGDCPSFNTVAACAATAASSLTSSGVTSSSATLNWLPGFGGWEEYLYVDSDSSKVANGCPSNDCVVNANILEGTATYALSGLSPSKTYYWKVLEYSSGTCSNSASSSLLTQAVAVTTVPTAFVGQSNVVVGIPLGTRFNSTNISITTYINGTLVCPNAPSTAPYLSVVYSLAGTTKPATLLQCSNGVSVYSVNTTNFGLYQLSVYFNAGATIGNFTRQANLERFSDEGHAYASPDFWVGLVPVVALAALYLRKGKSG